MTTETKTPGDLMLEEASRHWKSLGPRSIEVPEWKGTIWFTPVTLAEQQAFLREGATSGGMEHAYVKAIIDKATDEQGNKLFTLEHRMRLLHASYGAVVQRVGEAIMSTRLVPLPPREKGESPQEQLEKN